MALKEAGVQAYNFFDEAGAGLAEDAYGKLESQMKGKRRRTIMNNTKFLKILFSTLGAVVLLAGLITAARAGSDVELSAGQIVYVPIYSHIYSGLRGSPFSLAATLSIRNTDPKHAITLVSVKFYDSDGKLIKEYLDKPAELKAMASTRYILTEADNAGGSGANFLVKWTSKAKVNPPLIEGVMIGTRSGQGISFVSRGQVIDE